MRVPTVQILKVSPKKKGFDVIIYVGQWAMRFTDPRNSGRFNNGSRWRSPLSRWREDE